VVDANGYCLLYKRLHQAVFIVPSTTEGDSPVVRIDAMVLASLLAGVEKQSEVQRPLDRTSSVAPRCRQPHSQPDNSLDLEAALRFSSSNQSHISKKVR
jgi:IS66 Orf2 like protein